MGTLIYNDPRNTIEFDDRTLFHLQLILGAKLRRRESFFFSWSEDRAHGSGRSSLWIEASIALKFTYSDDNRYDINHEWIEKLSRSSATAQGLYLCAEPNTAEPNTAEPNTAEPNTAEPNTAEPNVAEPNVAAPNCAAPNCDAAKSAAGLGRPAEPDSAAA
jgi:hypothetical protein